MPRWLCLLLFFIPSLLFAHNENEVSFILHQNELQIHLTPKKGLDLFTELGIISPDETLIQIGNHDPEITDYFNENISQYIGGKEIEFELLTADMQSHDARLIFQLQNLPPDATDFSSTIDCFTEIYNRPLNYVEWKTDSGIETCTLDKTTRTCSFGMPQAATERATKTPIFWLLGAGMIVIISAGYFAMRRSRNPAS